MVYASEMTTLSVVPRTIVARANRFARIGLAASLLSLGGCADNAILELTLELPSGEEGFAFVQFDQGATFEEFEGSTSLDGFPLDGPASVQVSVIADGDEIEAPLRVKVRFCQEPRCTFLDPAGIESDDGVGELRFELERAFYRGRFTEHTLDLRTIPERGIPPTLSVVDKCEVGGCRDGTTVTNSCRADGTHFCE